jgi:hypothetical protein
MGEITYSRADVGEPWAVAITFAFLTEATAPDPHGRVASSELRRAWLRWVADRGIDMEGVPEDEARLGALDVVYVAARYLGWAGAACRVGSENARGYRGRRMLERPDPWEHTTTLMRSVAEGEPVDPALYATVSPELPGGVRQPTTVLPSEEVQEWVVRYRTTAARFDAMAHRAVVHERMPVNQLARQLGVSNSKVRAAVRRVEEGAGSPL